MLSKREAAEENIKAGCAYGCSVNGCNGCPFDKECSKSEFVGKGNEGCVNFCKQWLKDNPVEMKKSEMLFKELETVQFDIKKAEVELVELKAKKARLYYDYEIAYKAEMKDETK